MSHGKTSFTVARFSDTSYPEALLIDELIIRAWRQKQLEDQLDLTGLLAQEPRLPADLLAFLLKAEGEMAEWAAEFLTLLPPSTAPFMIQAADDPAYQPVFSRIARALAGWDVPDRRAAFRRWLDSPDPEIAHQALRQLPAVPMPAWTQELYRRIAMKTGHPLRYEAMLLMNAGMIPRPRFGAALRDPDAKIRSAAYCNLAIHGCLSDIRRLAQGMNDSSPEVRDTVLGCLWEALVGSEVDQRLPLFERKWKPLEMRGVNRLRKTLEKGFRQIAAIAHGDARNRARAALAMLTNIEPATMRKPSPRRGRQRKS